MVTGTLCHAITVAICLGRVGPPNAVERLIQRNKLFLGKQRLISERIFFLRQQCGSRNYTQFRAAYRRGRTRIRTGRWRPVARCCGDALQATAQRLRCVPQPVMEACIRGWCDLSGEVSTRQDAVARTAETLSQAVAWWQERTVLSKYVWGVTAPAYSTFRRVRRGVPWPPGGRRCQTPR